LSYASMCYNPITRPARGPGA